MKADHRGLNPLIYTAAHTIQPAPPGRLRRTGRQTHRAFVGLHGAPNALYGAYVERVPGELMVTLPPGANRDLDSVSSTESCSDLMVARAILQRFRMA